MFLRDLFRYRSSDKKENREDFLSSCLAELMRRDQRACKAVLKAVGFKKLPSLDRYNVRTQVGIRDGDRMRWCDIMVQPPHEPPLLIECKVDADPDVDQIQRYKRLWSTDHVALLARRSSLPAHEGEWEHIAQGSWQKVWEAIHQLKPSPTHQHYREAVHDLMDHLNLSGRPTLTEAAQEQATTALETIPVLRSSMREAVQSLLTETAIQPAPVQATDSPSKTQPVWTEHSDLDVYWERYKARDGSHLLGLGLQALPRAGVGTRELEWWLWLYPSPTLEKTMKALVKNEHLAWEAEHDWYGTPLGELGGPHTPFGEQLAKAVTAARICLREDVQRTGIGKRKLTARTPELTAEAVSGLLEASEGWAGALHRWCVHWLQDFQMEFNQEGGPHAWPMKGNRHKLFMRSTAAHPREVGAGPEFDGDDARLVVWAWLGSATQIGDHKDSLVTAMATADGSKGGWEPGRTGSLCFRQPVPVEPLSTLHARLTTLRTKLLAWLKAHGSELGIQMESPSQ